MSDLPELLSIVNTLERLCARFYGPRCAQTLLTSNTGKALVTSDGLTILESISLSHPIANLIVSSLKKCHSVTYDGSKTFLLYLKFLLIHLIESIDRGNFAGTGINLSHTNGSLFRHGKVCAALGIHDVSINILGEAYSDCINHPSVVEYSDGNLLDILSRVCKGTLCPHFNIKLCKHFSDMLTGIIMGFDCIETVRNILLFETVKFNQLIIKVAGRNYSECTIFNPFLLKRSKHFRNNMSKEIGGCVRAVCLQLSNDDTEDPNLDIGMMVKHVSQIHRSLVVKRKVVEKFAQACIKSDITLVICSDSLPEYSIDILHKYDLSVLTNVLKEDVDLLELYTHTTSVVSFMERIEDTNIIILTGVKEVSIGSEQFLHLKSNKFNFKHVIVSAPSPGLCDQTALLLQKTLKAMHLSLEDLHKPNNDAYTSENTPGICQNRAVNFQEISSACNQQIPLSSPKESKGNNTVQVVPAGGSFEIIMARVLQNKHKTLTNPHNREVCHIISESLLHVVKTLHENMSVGKNHQNATRFIYVKTDLLERCDKGKLACLNKHGKVCDDMDEVLLEPLPTKIHILESVLSLVTQVLRIDNIIPVKRQNLD